MKRFISSLILLLAVAVTATAQGMEMDDIFYQLNGDHAVVIAGSYPYSGDVTIPSAIIHNDTVYPVTAISPVAFKDCTALTSVSIPESVTAIGEQAFAGCTALDSVDISNLSAWCGIDFESESANPCYRAHHLYLNGEEITDLVIPDSVPSISSFAFSGCSSFNSVSIPSTVREIGASVFSNCPSPFR